METLIITHGPRWKDAAAVGTDWTTHRPAHELEEGSVLGESGEPVGRQVGNYIEYAEALGVEHIDPVLVVDDAKHINTSSEVQAADWKRMVDSALGVTTEIVRA